MAALVKLVNVGDTDFTDQFNGTTFTIPAHDAELVPDGAMRVWLGDPEARDYPRDRQRKDELDRLKIRFAANSGAGPDDVRPSWDEVRPKLEAYTVDGTRLYTVIDDPEGTRGAAGAPVYSVEQLSELVVKLVEANARLEAQAAQTPINETPIVEAAEQPITNAMPPADKPNRVQVTANTPKNRKAN